MDDEFADLEDELFAPPKAQDAVAWPTSVVLLGKAPPSAANAQVTYWVMWVVFVVLSGGVLLIFQLLMMGESRQAKKQMEKWREEHAKGVLNPSFLHGTGLLIHADQTFTLLTSHDRPDHRFHANQVTALELNQHARGIYDPRGAERQGLSGIYVKGKEERSSIFIHIDGTKALRMDYDGRWKKAFETTEYLADLLNIDYRQSQHFWTGGGENSNPGIAQTDVIRPGGAAN